MYMRVYLRNHKKIPRGYLNGKKKKVKRKEKREMREKLEKEKKRKEKRTVSIRK